MKLMETKVELNKKDKIEGRWKSPKKENRL
jgi:hypothetical protein